MKIAFLNTSVPVAPVWEDSFLRFREKGYEPVAIVVKGEYRIESKAERGSVTFQMIPCPAIFRKRKLVRHALFALLSPWYLWRSGAEACVFLTQPPFFHAVGRWVCRLLGIPYAVHVMDEYPEVLFAAEKVKRSGWVGYILRSLAGKSYQDARGIVTLGPCATRLMRNYFIPEHRIHEVPNWAFRDIHSVKKTENPFVSEHGLQDKFVVLYSGNLGLGHEIDAIARVVKEAQQYDDILFLFIGAGRGMELLREKLKEQSNVRFLPFLPESELANSLSAASVHYVSLREPFSGVMVPSKIYGCFASGRPVIYEGPEGSTVAEMIGGANCGAVVRNGDSEGLLSAILEYRNNPEKQKEDGLAAKQSYEAAHTADISADRYVGVVEEMFPIERLRKEGKDSGN